MVTSSEVLVDDTNVVSPNTLIMSVS